MQTRTQLIYNDICVLGVLGCMINRWGQDMMRFWMILFVYLLVKQFIAHRENYKVNNRLF